MAAPKSPPPGPSGSAGDAYDLESEFMSEDDFETEDLLDDNGVDLEEESQNVTSGNVPVWRLIEMSRENRHLEREIADFEDYDTYFEDGFAH